MIQQSIIIVYTIVVIAGMHFANYLGSIGKMDKSTLCLFSSIAVLIGQQVVETFVIYYGATYSATSIKNHKLLPTLHDNSINQFQCKLHACFLMRCFTTTSLVFYIVSILSYIIIGCQFPIIWIGFSFQIAVGYINYIVGKKISDRAARSELIFKTYTSKNIDVLVNHFGIDKNILKHSSFEEQCLLAFIEYKKDIALLDVVNYLTSAFMCTAIEVFLCLTYLYFSNALSSAYFVSGCIVGIGSTINKISKHYRQYKSQEAIASQD